MPVLLALGWPGRSQLKLQVILHYNIVVNSLKFKEPPCKRRKYIHVFFRIPREEEIKTSNSSW